MRSIAYLFFTVICWGLNFHFAKQMLTEASFVEAGFWRYVFGVGILLLISIKNLPKPNLFFLEPKGLLLVGVIGLFGFNILFFLGMLYTSPINASLIVALNPAMTLIFSFFILKTVITKNEVFGMVISFFGVVFLLSQGDFNKLLQLAFSQGDILMFTAINVFALHNVWVKKFAPAFSNIHFTIFTNIICLLGFLCILPFAIPVISVHHEPNFWWSAIGIGSFGTGLAYLAWNKGVSVIGASRASIFMNFVPISTGVAGLFFGEQIYSYHYWSGLIIITGIIITQSKNFLTPSK